MSPRLLLGLGAAFVVVCALALLGMMPSGEAPAAAPAPRATHRAEVTPAVTADSPPALPAGPRTPVPGIGGSHDPAPSLAPGAPPAPPKDPKIERIDSERRWMNAEILSTEQAVLDCVGKNKLDGYVTIPFRIVHKADKVVVDAQPADVMTFSDPAIGECMRTATGGMKFDSLPDGVATVSSYRKIIFKDGQLVEDWLGPHETNAPKP